MAKNYILIAEDERHMSDTLSLILRREGHRVTIVESGLEALSTILEAENETNPFNLLITDIQMPDLTGLEVISRLEQLCIPLPVLVITGYGDEESLSALKRNGCSGYLKKPFSAEELLENVSRILKSK